MLQHWSLLRPAHCHIHRLFPIGQFFYEKGRDPFGLHDPVRHPVVADTFSGNRSLLPPPVERGGIILVIHNYDIEVIG